MTKQPPTSKDRERSVASEGTEESIYGNSLYLLCFSRRLASCTRLHRWDRGKVTGVGPLGIGIEESGIEWVHGELDNHVALTCTVYISISFFILIRDLTIRGVICPLIDFV